jgi:L-lactate dehydrogenase complex protein LldG
MILAERDRILAKIRYGKKGSKYAKENLNHGFSHDTNRKQDHTLENLKYGNETLISEFEESCNQLPVKVLRTESIEKVHECLSSILKDKGIRKAGLWDSGLILSMEIEALLKNLGIRNVWKLGKGSCRQEQMKEYSKEMGQSEVGITGADYGLADTGTLVLRSVPGQDRGSSLLPPVHITLLDRSKILPGSDELLFILAEDTKHAGSMKSCITLITGPSKTADIELTLVRGVHGPGELFVILLDFTLPFLNKG